MRWNALVEVRLLPGIADPAGTTIERSLPTLGFEHVSGVRTGKAIRFDVDAADEPSARATVEDLCRRFLTNPVIEDAAITLQAAPAEAPPHDAPPPQAAPHEAPLHDAPPPQAAPHEAPLHDAPPPQAASPEAAPHDAPPPQAAHQAPPSNDGPDA